MTEKRATIALLTDFGHRDSYVAEMKAVILSINPVVNIVDITHGIEPQNILQAAILLQRSAMFFPRGTIFVCVVDPEVGTSRSLVFVRTATYDFVAPDNGLLWLTIRDLDVIHLVSLENYDYFISRTPSTFEGRDKLAPVSAYASLGIEPTQFGSVKTGIKQLELPRPVLENDMLIGELLYFDNFGNAISNINISDLLETESANLPSVIFREEELGHIHSTFAEAENGAALAYFGSSGYLELAVNNGSFRLKFRARPGEKVAIVYGQ